MKGTNRATIHYLNKEKLHMLTTYWKASKYFWDFKGFVNFYLILVMQKNFGFSEFCKFLFGFMQGFESSKDRV